MKILVLGSSAGGGFPQWNCNCRQCAGHRSGHIASRARTQSSIAISSDGESWVLINASPDLGQQLRSNAQLHPRHAPRHSPITAVVLMDAQIDHVTGLLSMREGAPINLHCTPHVFGQLTEQLPILKALDSYCRVRWHPLRVLAGGQAAPIRIDGMGDLEFRAIAVPGNSPPYAGRQGRAELGDNIALLVTDAFTGGRFFYAPGLARLGDWERQWMADATCVMVDGTFWTEGEMIDAGLSHKRAADMGHLPLSGSGGMLSLLDTLPQARKILVHINNSNPILDESSPQREELTCHGVEVAWDGMEIEV